MSVFTMFYLCISGMCLLIRILQYSAPFGSCMESPLLCQPIIYNNISRKGNRLVKMLRKNEVCTYATRSSALRLCFLYQKKNQQQILLMSSMPFHGDVRHSRRILQQITPTQMQSYLRPDEENIPPLHHSLWSFVNDRKLWMLTSLQMPGSH